MRMVQFIMPVCAMLAACSSPEEMQQATGGAPDHQASATARATSSSASGVSIKEETDLYSFEYAYPAAAASIPALSALLEKEMATDKKEMIANASADRSGAAQGGFPYHAHSLSVEWKAVADLPDWLSLTREFSTYTGGAHGISGVTSLVWNKQADQAMAGVEMFVSPAALEQAISAQFCPALNAERTKRRGEPVDPASTDSFSACPTIKELTVIPGSSNGKTFNRIGLNAGPYVAGPYVEGEYEITLPVDAAVLAAVKPEYRGAFSLEK